MFGRVFGMTGNVFGRLVLGTADVFGPDEFELGVRNELRAL